MKSTKIFAVFLIAALSLAAFACATASADTGAVEVRVTDAPKGNVTAIVVTTDQINIHKTDAGNQSGWETVFGGNGSNSSASFDLCQVVGVEEVLAFAGDVPAGKYNQVRMHVVNVNVTVDGEERGATVPSNWIKIVRPFEVTGGNTTTLLLDFDADKSVVVTGSGKVHFKPVIKLVVRKGEGPGPGATTNVSPTPEVTATTNVSPTPEVTATANVSPTPGATLVIEPTPSPSATLNATPTLLPTGTPE
jgi:hypothetical protein